MPLGTIYRRCIIIRTRGLEGVPAATTELSVIDGQKGELVYRGYNINELAGKVSFEEVAYLLWNGDLPDRTQYTKLCEQIAVGIGLPMPMMAIMFHLPQTSGPMQALRTAVSALALHDSEAEDNSPEANMRKAIHLTAHFPEVIAANYRLHTGNWPLESRSECGIARNFLWLLKGEEPTLHEIEAMDLCLVLHADHGLNASTFSARVTASTLSDMYSAVTSAIGTLQGPLHGGANQGVMRMLEEIGDVSKVEAYVDNALANKQRIMGFGHRVYKVEDPRAAILRRECQNVCSRAGNGKYFEISEKIREVVYDRKGLYPNVDFYSASVLHSIGIETRLFTTIFASSRIVGWTAHIMEQYKDNRLIRPTSEYIGVKERKFAPMKER